MLKEILYCSWNGNFVMTLVNLNSVLLVHIVVWGAGVSEVFTSLFSTFY